ncbi:MAG: hypothetical protein ONA69_06870 [candidate division KSB1 bacterium]|nr:hypothetical protein [candidate division KSB1 bacterium]
MRRIFFFNNIVTVICFASIFPQKTFLYQARANPITCKKDNVFAPLAEIPLKQSDVCFSSRWRRPQNANDPYDTIQMAKVFFATRIDWIYTYDKSFIQQLKTNDWPISAALNANLPDLDRETYQEGRMVTRTGEPICPPWMTWEPKPYGGCANAPEYFQNLLERAKRLIEAGADSIQFDDPSMNQGALGWGGGGCFCVHCVEGFKDYLKSNVSKSKLHSFGIEDVNGFSYRDFLNQGGNNPELESFWKSFQKESVRRFWVRLRNQLFEKYGRHILTSSNNFDISWETPYDLFDFGMCELPKRSFAPEIIYDRLQAAFSEGRKQIITIHSDDVKMNQICVATIYACGANPIVPWDVWIEGHRRFFGKPEDFAPLFAFVRANADCFDDFKAVAAGGKGKPNPDIVCSDPETIMVVRKKPRHAKTVVHLVRWGTDRMPVQLTIAKSIVSYQIRQARLLKPTAFSEDKLQETQQTHDFSKWSQTVTLTAKKENATICIKPIEFDVWAIVILD